ncbi:hypothetical protein TNCV_2318111 [Trichonephila clavipes]|nr:hypothetical protein TNCV_2318111 [Trichonephila clavipes]
MQRTAATQQGLETKAIYSIKAIISRWPCRNPFDALRVRHGSHLQGAVSRLSTGSKNLVFKSITLASECEYVDLQRKPYMTSHESNHGSIKEN